MQRINLGERPTSRSDLGKWYSAALAAQERSGLSVTEYADELGVTASTLYRWQRRLKGQGEGEDRAATPFGLVEVGLWVDGAQAPVESEGLVVRVGGGRRIEVPRGFDGDDLGRLVAVLVVMLTFRGGRIFLVAGPTDMRNYAESPVMSGATLGLAACTR